MQYFLRGLPLFASKCWSKQADMGYNDPWRLCPLCFKSILVIFCRVVNQSDSAMKYWCCHSWLQNTWCKSHSHSNNEDIIANAARDYCRVISMKIVKSLKSQFAKICYDIKQMTVCWADSCNPDTSTIHWPSRIFLYSSTNASLN